MMKVMTLTGRFYPRGQLTLWLHPKSENNPRQKKAVAGLQGTDLAVVCTKDVNNGFFWKAMSRFSRYLREQLLQ